MGRSTPARTATRSLTAGVLWLGPGRVLRRAAVSLDDRGRVVHIGRTRGRLQFHALLPGLVDAHVHSALAPLAKPERRFVPWIRAVLAARAGSVVPPDLHTRARLDRVVRSGVSAIGEVDSTGSSPAALRSLAASGDEPLRIAGRCYREVLGFDLDAAAARRSLRAEPCRGTLRCPAGWSPHAPYSVSDPLLRAAVRTQRPLMVHVAESVEEVEFLRTGRGSFRELLRDLGRLPARYRPRNTSSLDWLERNGGLRRDTALVHCQHLETGEAERIRAAGASIVVCPGTIRYFRRSPPPVADWLGLGIPVALGTDSLASHDGRGDLLEDLGSARELWPTLTPEQVLTMATASGARAIRRRGLGTLTPGRPLDAWALSDPRVSGRAKTGTDDLQVLLDRVTTGLERPAAVWVGGVRIETNSSGSHGTA